MKVELTEFERNIGYGFFLALVVMAFTALYGAPKYVMYVVAALVFLNYFTFAQISNKIDGVMGNDSYQKQGKRRESAK